MSDEARKALDALTTRVENLEKAVFGQNVLGTQQVATVDLDVAALSYIKELKSAPDRCLAILDYLFSKDPNHAGLTPNEFASILRERFGLPIPLQTISSQLLAETGRYVTRKKISNRPVRYRYQILPRGQEYIRGKISELQS